MLQDIIIFYGHAELFEMAQEIRKFLEELTTVFIITNNQPNGNAIANTFQLKAILEKNKIDIYETSLKTYPVLKPITDNFETNLFI